MLPSAFWAAPTAAQGHETRRLQLREAPRNVVVAESETSALEARDSFALTVSGGVSLGAYEAGVQYFITEAMKGAGRTLSVATGASAGSVNALTAIMNTCRPPNPDPQASLGWDIWTPVGIAQLFDRTRVRSDALFHRDALRASLQRLKAVWARGLPEDCVALFGVSVTHREPELLELRRDGETLLRVPRQVERFALRIEGRGDGRPPRLSTHPLGRLGVPQARLLLEAGEDDALQLRNFDRLVELLFASSAFPIAFTPQPLDYCVTAPGDTGLGDCESPQRSLFVDGGMFDNTPLRLAVRLSRPRPVPGAVRPGWNTTRYVYVDPGTRSFPDAPPVEGDVGERTDALDVVADLGKHFIATARSRELMALLEEGVARHLASQVILTRNHMPPISSHMGGFFGFFDHDFRVFDFYLGAFDAYVEVQRYVRRTTPESGPEVLERIFPVLAGDDPGTIPAGYRPFACMLSQLVDGYAGYARACEGAQLRNFRILLQVTMDHLHENCAASPAVVKRTPAALALCRKAAAGGARRDVPGVPRLPEAVRRRAADENEFEHVLRQLIARRYAFADLGLGSDEAEDGPRRIRDAIVEMVDALADAQSTPLRATAVREAGRMALSGLSAYEPPEVWNYLVLGTAIEAGTSRYPLWERMRMNFALQLKSWNTITSLRNTTIGLTPAVGIELEGLSTASFQTMLGLRAGYQLRAGDRFLGWACSADRVRSRDARDCSQLVLQPYGALSILERLRVQLTFELFPERKQLAHDSRVELQLGIGVHFR